MEESIVLYIFQGAQGGGGEETWKISYPCFLLTGRKEFID